VSVFFDAVVIFVGFKIRQVELWYLFALLFGIGGRIVVLVVVKRQ